MPFHNGIKVFHLKYVYIVMCVYFLNSFSVTCYHNTIILVYRCQEKIRCPYHVQASVVVLLLAHTLVSNVFIF